MNPAALLPDGITPADVAAWFSGGMAALVVVLVWRALLEDDPLPTRIRALSERRGELRRGLLRQGAKRHGPGRAVDGGAGLRRWLRRVFRRHGPAAEAMQLRLARAGIRSAEARYRFALARLVCPFAMGLTAMGLTAAGMLPVAPSMGPLVGALGFGFGVLAPGIWIANLAQKRQEAIRKQLPDCFDLLVICAEAGLSLHAALDRVARETARSAAELSDELALTALELSFLPDRHKAMTALGERAPLPGVRALVNTFLQTERYGTPLAQALRVLAGELREERLLKAEEKAARLPAILTVPMIVFILPPLFVVLMGPAILRTIDGLSGLK